MFDSYYVTMCLCIISQTSGGILKRMSGWKEGGIKERLVNEWLLQYILM